jgi:hypothetical protein
MSGEMSLRGIKMRGFSHYGLEAMQEIVPYVAENQQYKKSGTRR